MATYRQIHVKIWSSPDFQELSCNAKFVFIYLFSNSHRNEAAIYRITPKTISNETDIPVDHVRAALDELTTGDLIRYDHEEYIVWVVNAIKYQKMSPNEIKSIRNDLAKIKHPFTEELEEYYKDILSTFEGISEVLACSSKEPPGKGKGNDKGNDKGKDKDKGKVFSLEIEKFRSRYLPEQLEIIDRFFEILRTTRISGKLADSVVAGIYRDMDRYDPLVVEYACTTVIKKPDLHSKKENYFAGILRNTTVDEAIKGLQGGTRASPGNRESKIAVIDQYFGTG